MKKGKLFVIDGTDGSGKQTQLEKLRKRLDEENIEYKNVSFPNYESPSSSLVKMYLSGEFGQNAKEISPYIASTFYAADRYTTSNMIHQAGKIKDDAEREKFLDWLWDFEFNLYKIPIPTETFFLNMPTEYALKLIANRENKFSHTQKKDIHEKDETHLRESYNEALKLVKKYNWKEIKCVKDEKVRSIDDIHGDIWKEIKKYL